MFDKQTSYNDFDRLINAFRLIINERVKCNRYIEFDVRFLLQTKCVIIKE